MLSQNNNLVDSKSVNGINLDVKQVLDIYDDDYAREYNKRFIKNDASKGKTNFEKGIIEGILNAVGKDAKWLDIACGTGYFLSCFPHIQRSGLDISPAMLNIARQENSDVLFVEGDFRDKHPYWKGEWDLVSCMWWAYCYVNSLAELEQVIENFACWTSESGTCFLPICDPEAIGACDLKLPQSKSDPRYDGMLRFDAVIWSWVDAGKQHLNLLAPRVEYMVYLCQKYFDQVEVLRYPLLEGRVDKAIVARLPKSEFFTKL